MDEETEAESWPAVPGLTLIPVSGGSLQHGSGSALALVFTPESLETAQLFFAIPQRQPCEPVAALELIPALNLYPRGLAEERTGLPPFLPAGGWRISQEREGTRRWG